MALVFRGRTECALCGKALMEADDIVAFAAFLRRPHPWWRFSDAAFHRGCFENWADRVAFEALYQEFWEIWESRPLPATFEEMERWGKQAFRAFDEKIYGKEIRVEEETSEDGGAKRMLA